MTPALQRILQITAPGPHGGRETVVADLSTALHEAGHAVEVLAVLDRGTDPDSHPFVRTLAERGVALRSVILPPRAYREEARAVRAAIVDAGATILHSHGYRTDVVGSFARRGTDCRFVSTAHGFTGGGWKNRLYERLQARAWRHGEAVIAVSEPLVRAIRERGVDRSKIRLIPNAWRRSVPAMTREEARSRLGIPAEAKVAGWTGRLSAEKGPDVALEALARTADEEIQLHFVGEGRMRTERQARAEAEGLGHRVRGHGAIDHAADFFPAFDLFLLSSRTEGTPMVLFEAMAAEIPIVATSVGGVPDVLTGSVALLVPPGEPGALARALDTCFAATGEARRRAELALQRLRTRYAPEAWVEAHVELYRDIGS
ncbi:MAG: glycosyltransferase family 4 protein [Gemmatimonadota bacterium]